MPRLGPSHLGQTRQFEVQRTNNFELMIFDLPGGNASETLKLAVTGGPSVATSVGVIDLPYGNRSAFVAGKASFNAGQITVKDFIEADVAHILQEWHRQVYDPSTDQIGWASEYKKDAKIYEFSPDGTVVRSWVLQGVWPPTIDYGQNSNASSGAKEISFTLQYDLAIPVRD